MTAPAPPLAASLNARLSFMMFLQYAIWGAWLPLLYPFLSNYRKFSNTEISTMFAVGAIGAIFAPFIAGQIVDRHFATQKFLGISHIVGGILVWQLATLESIWAFLIFSLLYSIIYAPTLSLTNSLAFHHLPDRDRDFGRVRVWGTVGWIVVGITIGQWLAGSWSTNLNEPAPGVTTNEMIRAPEETVPRAIAANPRQLEGTLTIEVVDRAKRTALDKVITDRGLERPVLRTSDGAEILDYQAATSMLALPADEQIALEAAALGRAIRLLAESKGMRDAFRFSALIGVLMGLYCFVLPHTPPTEGRRANAPAEALTEIKRNPLLMLFLLAVPVSCIHQFYFVHTAGFLGKFQSDAAAAIDSVFGVGGGGLMTIGQMSEILVLAAIPLVAKAMSRKMLLGVGLVSYALRMCLFAYVAPIHDATAIPEVAILMAGTALHGFCFGCFIFVAFMIVDEETTGDVRASAQSLFNLVIVGVGIIVGSYIAGWVADWATTNDVLNYTRLFSVPMWASVACLAILLIGYPGGRKQHAAPAGEAA